jgi:hypothetical protein
MKRQRVQSGAPWDVEWLARTELVHRQLRDFSEPYATVMRRVCRFHEYVRLAASIATPTRRS